ncbi:MAG: toprim domain-containing protein [Dechloromonas sp.]|nr:toprim domain-containing protein [Dechloromonas sp.]
MQRLNVRDVALGKWPGLLRGFGLTERQLSGKHGPCPVCGGTDRFRFDNKDGRGTFFCSHCGSGDGFALLGLVKGWTFKEAAWEVEQVAGTIQAGEIRLRTDEAERIERLRRVWAESKPLQDGDEAVRYLAGRGLILATTPDSLRLHSSLPYYNEQELVGKFPALVARVAAPDGSGATLHRTYLQDGKKAPVPSPKKLMPGKPIAGAAIRLAPAGERLGIAEGIETALAASQMFNCPVWSCISAAGIESFEPPDEVRALTIFSDHDANFTGQSAAYAVAHRLAVRGVACEVAVPPNVGDWLDVLNAPLKAAVLDAKAA